MHKNSQKLFSVAVATLGAAALVATGTSASVAAAPDVFAIDTLTTDNAVFTEGGTLGGDDDGLLGVTGSKFIWGGDSDTIAWDLADLANPYVTDVDNDENQNNWLFSDLKTQTSYVFDADEIEEDVTWNINGFTPLDQTGDVSAPSTPLSVVVTYDTVDDSPCVIFASGYGRVAIWDGCLGVIYDIALPSGEVTTVTGAATFADYDATVPVVWNYWETDNYVAGAAVVEYDGTALHIVASGTEDTDSDWPTGAYRYDVQNVAAAPVPVLVWGDEDFVDFWKFTVSPATNQWCSEIEGGWDVIDGDDEIGELVFCASATFTIGAPALAATGLDSSAPLFAGAVVLLAGAGLVLVARRRSAQQS